MDVIGSEVIAYYGNNLINLFSIFCGVTLFILLKLTCSSLPEKVFAHFYYC